jgi:hypothetical protein
MARRPDFFPDSPLSPAALAELRQRYAMLSMSSLQQVYADAWERCKLERNGQLPRAEQIQVLVTARHRHGGRSNASGRSCVITLASHLSTFPMAAPE